MFLYISQSFVENIQRGGGQLLEGYTVGGRIYQCGILREGLAKMVAQPSTDEQSVVKVLKVFDRCL